MSIRLVSLLLAVLLLTGAPTPAAGQATRDAVAESDVLRWVDLTHPFNASTIYWPTDKDLTGWEAAHGALPEGGILLLRTIEILRGMTPEQKLAVMRSLIRQAYALEEAGVRALHPHGYRRRGLRWSTAIPASPVT